MRACSPVEAGSTRSVSSTRTAGSQCPPLTVPRRPPRQSGPHGEGGVRRLGLLTALYDWNGSFVPMAMGSSQSSGYGSTRVERRSCGSACRLEARSRGSTWATGASSASGARGRMARLCASSAPGQTSLITGTAVTTISPGEFLSNSFTVADSGAAGGRLKSLRHLSFVSRRWFGAARAVSARARLRSRCSQDYWRQSSPDPGRHRRPHPRLCGGWRKACF